MAIEEWKTILSKACNEYWEKENAALLLSSIPGVFASNGIDVQTVLQGRKLKDVLTQETSGLFRVLQNDKDRLVWGIVPSSVEIDTQSTQYFKTPLNTGHRQDQPPRYKPAFWKAFASELNIDEKRYLFSEPRLYYIDKPKDDAPPLGAIEVEKKFTGGNDSTDKKSSETETVSRISSWLTSHGADLSLYLIKKHKIQAKTTKSAMEELLAFFKPKELSRISVPLDIIARLVDTEPTKDH